MTPPEADGRDIEERIIIQMEEGEIQIGIKNTGSRCSTKLFMVLA